MTYNDVCLMLGDREVVIYKLKQENEQLKAKLAALTVPEPTAK